MTVNLGVWRTPVEPAPRLAEAIGLAPGDLWIKRDDYLSHGGGGNKLRKLEHLLDEARDRGATHVVAHGAPQSNFVRAAAASARRLGLEVVVVLPGDAPAPRETGNLTLDGLFAVEVRWVGNQGGNDLTELANVVADGLRTQGHTSYVLPYGGSSAIGARGYMECAQELREQAGRATTFVVPVGSGGTMAGLVAGLGAERVLGFDVGAVPDAEKRIVQLCEELGEPVKPGSIRLRGEQIGAGYGQITPEARRAILLAGRTQGLILDPVYGAKAMAGLMAGVKEGAIGSGERTVFIATGGLPGLFGHHMALELANAMQPKKD